MKFIRILAVVGLSLTLTFSAFAAGYNGGYGVSSNGGLSAVCTNSTTPVSSGSGCNYKVLTSAQILGMDITPITLLTAPGANKVIVPTAILVQSKTGTVAYLSGATTASFGLYYNTVSAGNQITAFSDAAGAGALFLAAANTPKTTFNLSIAATVNQWSPGTSFGAALAPTVFANQPIILASAGDSYNSGPITTLTVANGGAGYANGDTFNIDPTSTLLDTADATGHVVLATGGVVQTVAINTPGTAYSVTTSNVGTGPYPTVHTSGAGNDALTVNVTGATTGNGTGAVFIWYNVTTLQ